MRAPFWGRLRTGWQRGHGGRAVGLFDPHHLAIAAAEITAPQAAPFPLWAPILSVDWSNGILRTLPGEMFATSAWLGVASHGVLAIPLAALLLAARDRRGITAATA